MGDTLPPMALSHPDRSQPIGYQSSCFLKKRRVLGWGLTWSRPNPSYGTKGRRHWSLARHHGREIGDTTLLAAGGAWLTLSLPMSMEAPGPTLTTCTDQKPHEEVESHLCPLLLRKGVGVAKGSLACK